MAETYAEYRTLYLKGFDMMVSLIIAILVSLYSLYVIAINQDILSMVIYGAPLSTLPLFLTVVFKNKVRFGPDYIEMLTLFGKKRMDVKNVKLWGVYKAGLSLVRLVNAHDLEKFADSDLIKYNIFLITSAEFSLKALQQKSSVKFPYRKEFYLKVREIMKRSV
jgi:hypothetical protein